MIELKFLKELPVRSLNKTYCIQLNGADIYVDKDGNRFAYFGFRNMLRSPIFSLYIVIKQYDSFGSFIKETKFSIPSTFIQKGNYVTEKPVRISDECEGCEVYIAYAEFINKKLFKDALVRKSKIGEIIGNYFEGSPSSVSNSINSVFTAKTEETPVIEESKPVEEKKVDFSSTSEANAQEVVEEKAPAAEKIEESSTSENENYSITKIFRKRLSFGNLIILGAVTLCFVALAVVLFAIF